VPVPFDINGSELILILVVAVAVIGPRRLPAYTEQVTRWVKGARVWISDTRARIDEELGGEEAVDWEALDPRKYDPRRIVRDALLEPDPPPGKPSAPRGPRASRAAPRAAAVAAQGGAATSQAPTPYDDEAT
jgi:sec-independent protein translocase protein TatB